MKARSGSSLDLSRLGERVIDERISISADPMDPELGFAPFDLWFSDYGIPGQRASPIQYIIQPSGSRMGVLKNLSYGRPYALTRLGLNTGLPNSGAFRMSGGTTSIEEMISTTTRGLLVTRFDRVNQLDST